MNSYPIRWRRMESIIKKLTIFTILYWKYIIHFMLLNWKYVHKVFTILLPNFQSLFKHSQPQGACTVLTSVWEEFLSVALWKPLPRRSKRWPSLPADIHLSSNPKQLMLSGVSLVTVSNVNKPIGLVGLPYVMWSVHFFVTHTHTHTHTEKR